MVWTILDAAIMIAGRIFFLSGDILIKHYGMEGTADSRITYATEIPEFLKAI